MNRSDIAWRGFVTKEMEVIAWPTLLIEHNAFHHAFRTTDADFAARWRQWLPGGRVDFDGKPSPLAVTAVEDWLERVYTESAIRFAAVCAYGDMQVESQQADREELANIVISRLNR